MLTRLFPYIWTAIVALIFLVGLAGIFLGSNFWFSVLATVGAIVLFGVIKPWEDFK